MSIHLFYRAALQLLSKVSTFSLFAFSSTPSSTLNALVLASPIPMCLSTDASLRSFETLHLGPKDWLH